MLESPLLACVVELAYTTDLKSVALTGLRVQIPPQALMDEIRLERIVQTCSACPSQWDAWDKEGQRYYIRYRFGSLTVDKVPEDLDNSSILDWKNIFTQEIGGEWDGEMSLDDMMRHTGFKFTYPQKEKNDCR